MNERIPDRFAQLIIEGQTEDGARFRPGDWIERLIETVTVYGADRRSTDAPYAGPDRRRRQISFLQARFIDGNKCLVVDGRLRDANPMAFAHVMEFARSNRLRWRSV